MKLKTLMALAVALLCSAGAWAQKVDVTTQYISNPNFEGTAAITNEYKTYHKDVTDGCVSGLIAINGWTPVDGTLDARAGGPVTYGTSIKLSGQTVPASKPDGGANETALGIVAVWGANAQYLSDAVTLPAGDYTITVTYYNTTSATIKTNLFGFKESGGTTHYGSNNSFTTTGSWTTEVVNFTLDTETTGQFSVGHAMDNGNGGAAHLFLDNIKVEYAGSGHSAPSLSLRADLGDNISLANFVPTTSNYTLEVEGTAGTPIRIAGAGITYTPQTTGPVRFAKGTGSVYVYEGVDFMGVIAAGTPAFSTNIFTDENAKGSDNILGNGSFETLGDLISGQTDRYKLGTPWTSNRNAEASGIRVGTSGSTHRLVWRGKGDSKYFGQPVTGLKPNRTYQATVCQVDQGNGWADFNVGIGAAAGGVELASSKFTLGRKGSNGDDQYAYKGVWYTTFTTPSSIVEANTYYFTFANTNNGSHNDALTQIDWIALAEMENLPIEGVSSAKYTADGAFRPATPKDSYDDARNTAIAARDNSDYNVVTGSERTTLIGYINADEPTTADGYNTAASNLQNATTALINATSHYQALIDAQAAVPDLAYASAAASAFKTAVATSASDADEKVAAMTTDIRAYYESHAMAEGDATVIDYTSHLKNYNNPSNTDGWTITNTTGNSNMRIMNNESYTDADGTSNHSYFDSNSWGTAFATTFTQNIALTAGKYLFTVKARGNGTTTYKVIAGGQETNISAIGNTGGVFGRGWNDYSVEFTVAEAGNVTLGVQMETGASSNWLSFGNFRLVKLEVTRATSVDYDALNDAIDAAEDKTLGFEKDEYAPQNNLEALAALAAAKAINQSVPNEQAVVQAATTALTGATWTANVSGVTNIIYNGMFATVAEGQNYPDGWTRTNGWGQMQSDIDGAYTTAYYNQPGSLQYGNQGLYTLPLRSYPSYTAYVVRVTYRSHENNSNKGITISVYNQDTDEYPLPAETFTPNGSTSEWKTVEASFLVYNGKAGNHILTIANDGNTWITNVEMSSFYNPKDGLSSIYPAVFYDDLGYVDEPIEGCYPEAEINRTFADDATGTWYSFVAPFEITTEELEENFITHVGAEVRVAEFSDEGADADHVTVNFNTMTTPGVIPANTPVLIYFKKKSAKYDNIDVLEFDSPKHVYIVDEAKVEGTYFDFVGVYDFDNYDSYPFDPITIPAGDYFIGNNALYKSEGATTIKPFRAYLRAKSAGVKAMLFIDGVETGIEEIQGLEFKAQGSEIYNLAGQRLNKAQKGVNIVNGKKVLVK